MSERKYLGEMFIEAGMLTYQQLDEAINAQRQTPDKKLGEILVEKGFVTQQQLQEILEYRFGIPFVDLNRILIPRSLADLVPAAVARRNKLVPFMVEGNKLSIAMEDPFNIVAIEDVNMITQMDIKVFIGFQKDISNAIEELYGNEAAELAMKDFKRQSDVIDTDLGANNREEVGSAPIVRLIDSLLERAVREGASDIHVEPGEDDVRVRIRVDGALGTVMTTPKNAHSAMLTRIKIMGNLNIAEKRIPQDGRCELNILGHNADIRISTLPTVFGEKAVLRILDRSSFLKPKEALGFTHDNLKKFDDLLKNTHGIILVTGPTGSGKSTTLYTMLSELNKEKDNIITIEDPVEYMIKGLNQVHVNAKAGLDFATGLRSILRQDPDIIMVGEIRDQETVEIAIRAAVTGHLVLSTIHTNDAASTVSRLIDMGVEPYMLSSALAGIIAQRLVRKICPVCKEPYAPSESDLESLGLPSNGNIRFYHGKGCGNCMNTGYKGRIAVHEILPITRQFRNLIYKGAPVDEMRDYARRNGMVTIKDECVRLLREGTISLQEAISVAFTHDE